MKLHTMKLAIVFCLFLLFISIESYAQLSIGTGYAYYSVFSIFSTSMLPYVSLQYALFEPGTAIFITNNFFYSTDAFIVNMFNASINIGVSDKTTLHFLATYIPYNLIAIDNKYYSGHLSTISIGYTTVDAISTSFRLKGYYIKVLDSPVDSPINLSMSWRFLIPSNSVYFTIESATEYKTDDTSSSHLIIETIDFSTALYTSLKETIIPGFRIYTGYSIDNSVGSFYGVRLTNNFTSYVSDKFLFKNIFYADYKAFSTAVIPDDIDLFQLSETIGFDIGFSDDFTMLTDILFTFNFYPDQSVDNYILYGIKNAFLYNFENFYNIELVSYLRIYKWINQALLNYTNFILSIGIKFFPSESFIINLSNSFDVNFDSNFNTTVFTNDTRLSLLFEFSKNVSCNTSLIYKSNLDKASGITKYYYLLSVLLTYIF